MRNICNACNETLVLDADGGMACECAFVASRSNNIPATWDLTVGELEEARWQLEERAQGMAA
jgi:hypothetical protein